MEFFSGVILLTRCSLEYRSVICARRIPLEALFRTKNIRGNFVSFINLFFVFGSKTRPQEVSYL